ncbi:hypothetical protein chiPu_0022752, partial [Chiloscyllium punctatum]|nr:hypothetical protein [Chiloscyllium punctatum]
MFGSGGGGGGGGGGGRQGRALLEARFHYQYQAGDGRLVRMAEGDRFVLLNKSNQDWWRVRREGEPKRSKPIYVPAAYVVELPEEAPAAAHAGKRASLPGKLSPSSLDLTGAWSAAVTEKRSTLSGDPAFPHRHSWANLRH